MATRAALQQALTDARQIAEPKSFVVADVRPKSSRVVASTENESRHLYAGAGVRTFKSRGDPPKMLSESCRSRRRRTLPRYPTAARHRSTRHYAELARGVGESGGARSQVDDSISRSQPPFRWSPERVYRRWGISRKVFGSIAVVRYQTWLRVAPDVSRRPPLQRRSKGCRDLPLSAVIASSIGVLSPSTATTVAAAGSRELEIFATGMRSAFLGSKQRRRSRPAVAGWFDRRRAAAVPAGGVTDTNSSNFTTVVAGFNVDG